MELKWFIVVDEVNAFILNIDMDIFLVARCAIIDVSEVSANI